MKDDIQIIQADCIKHMKTMLDNSIDMAIVDAPYGDNAYYSRHKKTIQNNEHPLLNCQVLFDLQRLLKNDKTIYNFTTLRHYAFIKQFVTDYTMFKVPDIILCIKPHFGMGYNFRKQYEIIMVIEKGKPDYRLGNMSNVMSFDKIRHDKDTHPHQKPVDMLKRLINHSTKTDDTVFDPFLGSGSTAVACAMLGRKCIGTELESMYIDMSKKRVDDVHNQKRLV